MMNPRSRYNLVVGTLAAVCLSAFMLAEMRFLARAAEGDGVEYTFDRPITQGEEIYDWYRKTHADEAAKRYGVDPKAVGDGMDTWHWWTGVDNQKAWRKATVLTGSKAYGALNSRTDWLKMLQTKRADRWSVMGLINDPETVP